jgi:hypothetical protein
MKYYKYIRMILILIPIIILGVLAYKHICPGGVLKVDYDFCREDPFISQWSPMGRMLEIQKSSGQAEKYCYQEMVIDPVYFDVRLPQSFRAAKIKLWYEKNDETPLRIGPRLSGEKWAWGLVDVQYELQDGEWGVGATEVDLTQIEMDNNRIRFLVSSPGLDQSEKKIIFKKIEIEFRKEPLERGKIWERIKNQMRSLGQKFEV